MSESLLKKHQKVWQDKSVLREIYQSWYGRIIKALRPGKTVEIGGGTGNLKEYHPEIVTSDIIFLPWLDCVCDAQSLPFKDHRIDNLVLFDVVHHLPDSCLFFSEAVRVLRPGGRLVLMEPYVSLFSFLIYRFFHAEPLDLHQDPFQLQHQSIPYKPFDSNQAIPTLLFFRHKDRFQLQYPRLRFIHCERLALFAYPLSGGFDHPALLPHWGLRPLLTIEKLFQRLAAVFAFRLFVVLEKES